MPGTLRRIEVFIAAPADVGSERQAAIEVVEQLNVLSHVSSQYHLVPHSFEEAAPPVVGQPPQQVVDDYMLRAADSDVLICILWRRFGTPFVDPDTQERFGSGTEYEFLEAYRAHKRKGSPVILMYRCIRAPSSDHDLDQAKQVHDFFKRFEGADAEFDGLYKTYDDLADFKLQLLRDLDRVIANGALDEARSPVTLTHMVSNDGWMLSFTVVEGATEISYRMDDAPEFKSTGHLAYPDPRTGQPVADPSVSLGMIEGRHAVEVKFVDLYGVTKGPYALEFDTAKEMVSQAKLALKSVHGWISYGYHGELLAYFTFLLTYKPAIEEIRYSIDSDDVSKQLKFVPWKKRGWAEHDEQDETFLPIPSASKYICVQITFKGGTQTEVRRFDVPLDLFESDDDE